MTHPHGAKNNLRGILVPKPEIGIRSQQELIYVKSQQISFTVKLLNESECYVNVEHYGLRFKICLITLSFLYALAFAESSTNLTQNSRHLFIKIEIRKLNLIFLFHFLTKFSQL